MHPNGGGVNRKTAMKMSWENVEDGTPYGVDIYPDRDEVVLISPPHSKIGERNAPIACC